VSASDPSYESPRDRAALAREAGLGRLSLPSVLAGVLVAYGAFVVLAALVGAVAAAIGLNTDLAGNDWATLGVGSAIVVAIVLLLAYLFGGYVAGRMARRAGLLNGLAVFMFAVVLVAVVAAIAASQADADTVQANLRSLGIPTTGTEWGKVGTVAGVGSLAAMLVGALLGGVLGERWHTKLTRRAASGNYGPDRADRPTGRDRGNDLAKEAAQRQRRRDGDDAGATRIDREQPDRPTDQP
jgi:FtsH-binding integral membrane protein